MDDRKIIDLFFERSEDALIECARKYTYYCRSIAGNILKNNSDADECVNDTLLKVWEAIPPHRPESLKAYLGKIVRNLALDRYEAAHAQKRGGGEVELALDELGDIPTPINDSGEITQVINDFLITEAIEDADIFIKRYWYLQSIKEIASEYGFTESKVKSCLFRMRGKLKIKLESEGLI